MSPCGVAGQKLLRPFHRWRSGGLVWQYFITVHPKFMCSWAGPSFSVPGSCPCHLHGQMTCSWHWIRGEVRMCRFQASLWQSGWDFPILSFPFHEWEAEDLDALMDGGVWKQEETGSLNHHGREGCLLARNTYIELSAARSNILLPMKFWCWFHSSCYLNECIWEYRASHGKLP